MAEVRSLICDVCDQPNAVGYAIGQRGGALWEVDLCAVCAQPLTEWQTVGRMPETARRPYRKYKVKTSNTPKRDEKAP